MKRSKRKEGYLALRVTILECVVGRAAAASSPSGGIPRGVVSVPSIIVVPTTLV